ncbi:calcium-binding protein, partial [Sulfuricurvum sp.]|uniref:calcium-binding protein n=1 Tax=Sulfuricurvum sp. TaxID=2025608 RepID=UPI0026040689
MRNLTPGEINMLRDVFGDSINYSEVMIHPTGLPAPGVTLFGNVYINSGTAFNPESNQYQSDFSIADAKDQALFMHEMTHVWQSQNGYPTGPIGFNLQSIYKTGVVNPYEYELDPNKSFKDYNMEQQAKLIENYFLTKDNLKPELKRLVEDFINSDKGIEWLPTKESLHDILRKFREGLLHKISDPVNDLWHAFKNWVAPRRDPLVLDLDGDGIETLGVNATTHVVFDYDGDGVKTGTGWIKGDDGFVVLDRNGNGTIDNGGELFGDQTLVNGVKATDGFAALSAEDTNHNGKFDAGDTNFTNVRIWQDTNSDGISQAGELHTLNELGITSINLTSTTSNTVSNGNVQIAAGTYTKTNGDTGASGTLNLTEDTGNAGNLNFSQNPFYSEFTDHLALSDTALALPDMQGSGMVRDLREASTLSAGLTSTLQSMSTTYETHDEMMAQIDTLLEQWAGTSSMATSVQLASANGNKLVYVPTQNSGDYELYMKLNVSSSSGSSEGISVIVYSDEEMARYKYLLAEQAHITRMISILERFNAETFVNIVDDTVTGSSGTVIRAYTSSSSGSSGGGAYVIDPRVFVGLSATQISFLEQSYEALKQSVYDGLVLQTRLSRYMDAMELTISENGLQLDMSGVTELLDNRKENDLKNTLVDWSELIDYAGNNLTLIDANSVVKLQEWIESLGDDAETLGDLAALNGQIIYIKNVNKILNIGSVENDTIVGTTANEMVISGSGDDVVNAGAGNDTVYGDEGDDIISAGSGDDTLYGGDGNDNLDGGTGADILYGGDGDDILSSDYDGSGRDVGSADILVGGAGDDLLKGGDGNDTYVFNLGDGHDTIYDYDRNYTNYSYYNAGNDTIRFGEGISAEDVLIKFSGSNLILGLKEEGKTFEELSDTITITNWYNAYNRIENIVFADGSSMGSVNDIINLTVSEDDDTINGTELGLILDAKGGNDTITAGAGSDTINGGSGDDVINAGNGTNTVYGGLGNDTLVTGAGNDTVYGDEGDDIISAGSGDDTLYGGDGNDNLDGGTGAD